MADETDTNDEPLSAMRATAVALHEWFVNLLAAGFTEQQALSLITSSMRNHGDEQ